MKLICKKDADKPPLETVMLFDAALVKTATLVDQNNVYNTFALDYDVFGVGNPTRLPFKASEMTLYATITPMCIYCDAVAEFVDEEEQDYYESYITDGYIFFEATLTSDEEKQLLRAIIDQQIKNIT